ncbi:uncharacterized protein LOC114182082 isoform X2 [Vigna unguiculata]|uniref:uncharacterized protein LOC114182082 isoform X2 n=1 Tax=Vigna unguiculata TaxID=3917 RepID=UPI00101638B5|nr:uncharacterized protein LOC114182082 isoform X2 [Vigna unguiculata]
MEPLSSSVTGFFSFFHHSTCSGLGAELGHCLSIYLGFIFVPNGGENRFSLVQVVFFFLSLETSYSFFAAYFNLLRGSKCIQNSCQHASHIYSDAQSLRETCATPILKQCPWMMPKL